MAERTVGHRVCQTCGIDKSNRDFTKGAKKCRACISAGIRSPHGRTGPKPHGIIECTRCHQMKQFRAKNMCDACWQAARLERKRTEADFYTDSGTEKACQRCGETKTIEHYKKNLNMRDRLQAWCDECRHKHEKELREHPEWVERNKERARDSFNKMDEQSKREKHDRNYETEKARLQRDPEYRKRKNFQSKQKNNRRERLLSKEEAGTYTLEEWEALCAKYDYRCLCCKQKFTLEELTADHVIPVTDKSRPMTGRNTIANIQCLCRSCNSRKNNRYIDYR